MDNKKDYRHQALLVCTLGGAQAGKTSLTAAVTKVVSRIGSTPADSEDVESKQPTHHPISEGVGLDFRAVDYETSGRHYTQIDCVSHADTVKMLISGTPEVRGAIWVVSAVDGVTEASETQIRLASQVRIPVIITFLNQTERVEDPELIEICAVEIRELLTTYGYAEANSPIIVGGALNALRYKGHNLDSEYWKPIVDLILAMGRYMPQPINPLNLPLLMPIREVTDDPKGISTLRGDVVQGGLAVGHAVDIVGKGERVKTRLVALRDDEVQVDAEPGWISPGQVVSEPKSIKSHTVFEAAVYVMTPEECKTHVPLVGNDKPEIHLWSIDVTGHLHLPPDVPMVNPGEHAHVSIALDVPMALQVGARFEIKKMGARIGMGVVTEIVE